MTGTLKIDIHYNNSDSDLKIRISDKFSPNQSYFRIATTPHVYNIGLISSATVVWGTSRIRNGLKVKGLKLSKLEVKPMSLWDPELRSTFTTTLCGPELGDVTLEPNEPVTFTPCFPDDL